jgi:hypothetical protein
MYVPTYIVLSFSFFPKHFRCFVQYFISLKSLLSISDEPIYFITETDLKVRSTSRTYVCMYLDVPIRYLHINSVFWFNLTLWSLVFVLGRVRVQMEVVIRVSYWGWECVSGNKTFCHIFAFVKAIKKSLTSSWSHKNVVGANAVFNRLRLKIGSAEDVTFVKSLQKFVATYN